MAKRRAPRASWPLLALAVLSAPRAARADEPDRPFVEILQSNGAIDGPAEGGVAVPRWERVRLELRVVNRLAAEVRDLEVEVALVLATGEATAIPGWTFHEAFTDPLRPLEDSYLRIVRELPARRTSPPADEIAYRAHIKSYRLARPDLETAIRLLGSSHPSDQLAALKSYELDEGDKDDDTRDLARALGRGLARAITDLPEEPSASDALRMLFAVRALGTLGDARSVHTLLELPGLRGGEAWGRAVRDLATRMTSASDPGEPRLRVLPSWAREKALLAARSEDAVEDSVSEAILRMGDAAVPSLLLEAHRGAIPGVRVRAERLLHALGRATTRSQLSLRDREARLEVIEALGAIGLPEPVPALVELLHTRDKEEKEAVTRAIERIGPAAVEPLIAALGSTDDDAVIDVLHELGPKATEALARAALRYGVARGPREDPTMLLGRLHRHLADERRRRLVAELDRGLELGREGSYTEAFQRLDAVFAQDPALYMQRAGPIAETYLARAKRLHARGDFDAAVSTLKTGQSIQRLDEAEALLLEAELSLVRGYLELDDLDKAEELLDEADASHTKPEVRALEAKLLAARAEKALGAGDYGKARTLLERARTSGLGERGAKRTHEGGVRRAEVELDDADLARLERRLLFVENAAIVAVLALFVPALGLALALFVRRRLEAAKLARLERALDGK